MAAGPFRTVLRTTALAQVQHVRPVTPRHARHLVAEVYSDLEHDFGVLAPPIALHSPAPPAMAAAWLMLRESMVAGSVPRPLKEAVASAVSVANSCPYCVTVHSSALGGMVGGTGAGGAAAAIAGDRLEDIQDPVYRATAQWARDCAVRESADLATAPFEPEQAPELVGVAVVFHYLNRMVNVFLPDVPMPSFTPRNALPVVRRVLSLLLRRAARAPHEAGTRLDLLPDAPLPPDLAWAAGSPAVSAAFARAALAIDTAAETSVPESVRHLLSATLRTWDGKPPGLGQAWLQAAVELLPPEDRPAGRLALLTAVSSWQVDESVVADFRLVAPADKTLVELTSWAALAAARRIGAWTPAGPVLRGMVED
jgi:AhpD family alkylhydroperoxidase